MTRLAIMTRDAELPQRLAERFPERDVIQLVAIDVAVAARQRAALEGALSPAERIELAATVTPMADASLQAARRRRVVARACLRRILGWYCSAAPHSLPLVRDAAGKPRLATATPADRLRFNASHSGDVLLVALALDLDVGVDIEVVCPLADPLLIARQHFSAGEVLELSRLDEPQRTQAFYAGWTRKEAFLKATGDGLAGDFRSFDVSLRPGEPARIRRFYGRRTAERPDAWRIHSFEPVAGALAAIAVRSRTARYCWQALPERGGWDPRAAVAHGANIDFAASAYPSADQEGSRPWTR